jgi:formate-dependent nitrite reductase membrane component NrfD
LHLAILATFFNGLLNRVGIALALMAVAVGLTWVAARLTRPQRRG